MSLSKCYLCGIIPKSKYHHHVCTFIHKEPHRFRKHCRFYDAGCNKCILAVDYSEHIKAIMTFCSPCSESINVVRKDKYSLYFYLEDVDGPRPTPKDIDFSTQCRKCVLQIDRDSNNILIAHIDFCIKCSNTFVKITKGKNVLYFY